MDDKESQSMFSEEYSTESTENNSEPSDIKSEEIEGTIFSVETENYTITKPRRIIIKATVIKND